MENLATQSLESINVTQQSNTTRAKNFSVAEILLLCSGWSNTTNDAKVGIDQIADTFWRKAHAYWLKHKKDVDQERTPDALMQRFSRIKTAVSKFVGYLTKMNSISGYNETDKICKAKEMYKDVELKKNEGKKTPSKSLEFVFEHCWHVLKNDQKWLEVTAIKKSKNNEIPPQYV